MENPGGGGMIRKKVISNHRKNCIAAKNYLSGFWNTPWAYFTEVVWRDRRGGKTGASTVWAEAICNDPDCRAKLLVHMDDLWDAIHREDGGKEK